jgi:uncharacterized protein
MAEAPAYFDSSLLVKLYVEESGSKQVRRLIRRCRVLSSAIAPVEVVSAIGRRYRAGAVTHPQLDAIVARIHAEQTSWDLVEVSRRVLESADRLVREQPVRTLDALHIASALLIQGERESALPFATADQRQREAAAGVGLRVLWIAAPA